MAGQFLDLVGTSFNKLRIGLLGPFVKDNAGTVEARNALDSAYAAIAAALFKTYGNDFELNSGAAGSGADWKFTLRRPSSGMTHALVVALPAGDPAPGQALTVASFAGDVITLQYTTIAPGTDKLVVDTTTLAFGNASPLNLFTKPDGAVIASVEVVIDTPFNGTPSLSVGVSGQTSKYLSSTALDLTGAAATSYASRPNVVAGAGTEALIATYAAGSASAGAARILVSYVIPS